MALETGVQSLVGSYQRLKKMVLDAFLLNIQHDNVRINGKWTNLGKGITPSSALRFSSLWRGDFGSLSTTVGQITY